MREETLSTSEESLVRETLSLPMASRLVVFEKILESLEVEGAGEVLEAWLDTAEKRLSEIESGLVETIPRGKVFGNARAAIEC